MWRVPILNFGGDGMNDRPAPMFVSLLTRQCCRVGSDFSLRVCAQKQVDCEPCIFAALLRGLSQLEARSDAHRAFLGVPRR